MQSAQAYDSLSPRSHIRIRPDMYIGSTSIQQRDEYVAIDGKIQKYNINVSEAIERLFLEILSNAGDNVVRSRQAGLSEEEIRGIDVQVDGDTVSITNYGLSIPIEIKEGFDIYIPTMIFSRPLSSSNYGEIRDGVGGLNGVGCKAVFWCSEYAKVTIGNAIQKKLFIQEWSNHTYMESEPIIGDYNEKISFVNVTYKIDFSSLGYLEQRYTDSDIALFRKHVMDLSFTSKITTSFNGETYNFKDLRRYLSIFSFVPEGANHMIHIEQGNNNFPNLELCVVESPDDPNIISFTNGIFNRLGGTHTEAAIELVSNIMVPKVNAIFDKIKDGNKSKASVNKTNIRNHISIIISVRVVNPGFDSQSKNMLKTPKIKIKVTDEETHKLNKFNLLYKRLIHEAEAKMLRALKNNDGKKSRHIDVDVEDANYAGTKRSHECVLMITEGKSAAGYALHATKYLPGGRDQWGIYPMRGKPLNTMKVGIAAIISNTVIMELKKILGIKEGVDYTDDSNFMTLRYGKLLIMADSDEDGKHIIGLVLNIFHTMYPSLLQREYIMILRTPIIRVVKDKNHTLSFYSHYEYQRWAQETPNYQKLTHKYLKGLGSSNPKELEQDFKEPRYVQIVYDEYADSYMRLAFDKKLADDRKKWIELIREPLGIENWDRLPISHFINEELVTFARDNLGRSIPRLMDGLKESSRKIMWGVYCKWGKCGRYENGKRKISQYAIKTAPEAKSQKVGNLASFVGDNTAYKHGETCLTKTIAGMAADYPGANNMAYFFQDGMFGTRNMNGQDTSQPRYPFVKPIWWLPYIFRIEDFPFMDFKVDEGEDQEPVTFLPIIPMVLVNGADGIGSGHSTFIPKFNPMDITAWLKRRLSGIKYQPELVPWYRGFTGKIELIDVKNKAVKQLREETEVDIDEVNEQEEVPEAFTFDTNVETHKAVRISGSLCHDNSGNLVITEIPIGRSINGYHKYLQKLIKDGVLHEFRSKSDDKTANFTLIGYKGNKSLKDLHLISTMGMTNMVLLNTLDQPIKYDSVQQILEEFFELRLPYYLKRKEYMLSSGQKIVDELKEKYKFISEVVNGTIVIFKRKISELMVELEQKGYSKELCRSVSLSSCTRENMEELENKINQQLNKLEQIQNLSPEDIWMGEIEEFEEAYRKHYSS